MYSMIGCPVRLSDSPFAASPAPLMGQHTEDVLISLAGYTAQEVQQLRDKGVI
jgi:formyl-CoA transferase